MLAVLYDVHGNLPALEAVLADAEAQGADSYLLGGDYAAFGAWPAETVARLEALPAATWLRGNWERWQADRAAVPDGEIFTGAADYACAALGERTVGRHGTLPQQLALDPGRFCHASPVSDMDGFSLPPAVDEAADALLLDGVDERLVVFGHTHVQFTRTTPSGTELVNPGSVGLPVDGDARAAYALLDGSAITLRRVTYDHERAVTALEAIGEPWATATAARLRTAGLDVG